MKKFLLLSAFVSTACWADSASFMGPWGGGVQVGSVAAITLDRPYTERESVNLGLGSDSGDLTFYGDHVWYLTRDTLIHPYAGLGAGFIHDDERDDLDEEFAATARIPVGANYYTPNARLNVYLQVTPYFATSGDSDVDANIGLRYYF